MTNNQRWSQLWDRTPLFWKIFISSLTLMILVVVIAEGSEDLVKKLLVGRFFPRLVSDQKKAVETFCWVVAILISALGGSLAISRLTAGPLSRLHAAVERLSRGELTTRMTGVDAKRGDEIGRLSRGFNRMADSLTGMLENERRLLRDISHELRSPLARLRLSLALLERRTDPAAAVEAVRYLEQMNRDIGLMDEMVGDLLEAARLETLSQVNSEAQTGAQPLFGRARVDLSHIVGEAVSGLALVAESENRELTSERPEAAPYWGHGLFLRRIVDNLIKNALTHTPAGAKVQVRLTVHPESLVLTVTDQGPGLAADQLDKIFRPFYRVDDSRNRRSGGFGLGLAIVRQAVELHQGRVEAANRPEGGLVVTVTLPRSPESPDAVAR